MADDAVNIQVSSKLFDGLKKKLDGSSFSSVSELAEFILQQYLDMEEGDSKIVLTDQESKELHERLKKLGYD